MGHWLAVSRLIETVEAVKMQRINNRTAAFLLLGASWRKSCYSNPCGSCVEVAQLADGWIAVRNSRHPSGPALVFPDAEMAALVHGVKVGEFDGMVSET
jgi:Domain of unknown function (DUF397)